MKDLFGNEEIRALWWKQPYGTLMLHGKIETRTWGTSYRGLVLICTTLKPYSFEDAKYMSGRSFQEVRGIMIQDSSGFLNGYAIALGRLVESRPIWYTDKTFVEYRPELFSHVYQDVKRIEPFPLKGSQGWRIVTDEVRSKIKFI